MMAKLYILNLYKKRRLLHIIPYTRSRETLKNYQYIYLSCFFGYSHFDNITVLHVAIPQKSFCTVICR
jgi:hypothetical protein